MATIVSEEAIYRVLSRLPDARRTGSAWAAKCPAHDDEHASLSIGIGEDNRVLLHCHAGCSTEDIVQALGLTMSDLFAKPEAPKVKPRQIVATYDDTDADDNVSYQVVRYHPKDFRVRVLNADGEWIWGRNGREKLLYHLPRIKEAIEAGEYVFVVEGERDVHTLEEWSLYATTNDGGANNWRAEFGAYFTGAHVVVIPDADDAGRKHAHAVLRSVADTATTIRLLELPDLPPHGDVSDWAARGGTKEQLMELVDEAPEWESELEPEPENPFRPIFFECLQAHSTNWLLPGLLAEGGVTIIAGEPGAGKTTFCAELAWHVATGERHWLGLPRQGSILWLGFDDPAARIRSEKLELLGDLPPRRFLTLADPLPLSETTLPSYVELIRKSDVKLVVVDTLLDFMALSDFDKSAPVRAGMQLLRELVSQSGACVLATMHLSKDPTRQGVARVSNSTLLVGKSDIVCLLKTDHLQPDICRLEICKNRLVSGNWSQKLRRADGRTFPLEPDQRPRTTAERVVAALESAGGRMTREQLLAAIDGVSTRAIDGAIQSLRRRAVINVHHGEGFKATYELCVPSTSKGSK